MESEVNIIEFKNLYLDVKNTEIKNEYIRIINSLSGKIESGKLTAVFGNKGVGKTTFLDLLIGLVDKDSKTYGEILYNGKERDPEEWKSLISYVSKNKDYYTVPTLYEQMCFYMSLGNKKTQMEIDLEVNKILKDFLILNKKFLQINSLDIVDLCKGVIAISMAKKPQILIIDDPCEYLDANSSLNVITTLKKFAKENNCMVIISLDAPNDDLLGFIDDLIVLVKCGLFYLGPYSQFNSFLISNGIKNEKNLLMSEFLPNILSDQKNTPEAKKYEEIVENITENNLNNNITKICNNYKKLTWKCKFGNIKKIIERQILLLKGDSAQCSFEYYYAFSIFLCLFSAFIHFINIIKTSSIALKKEIKTCSYTELFYLSCALATYFFNTSSSIWFYKSFPCLWKFDSIFKKDYLSGQYSFGTYFVSIFCWCFFKSFAYFVIHFILWVLFYNNLMLQPAIFLFIFCFTFIFIILNTFFFILLEYNSFILYFFIIITLCVSGPDIGEKDIVLHKNLCTYLLALNPAYMFVVYLKTKCFDLLNFFKNRPEISKLLKNELFNLKICGVSYKDGIKGQIVAEYCGNWTDYVLYFNIIFSCFFIVVLVVNLFKVFRIPNARYKLS